MPDRKLTLEELEAFAKEQGVEITMPEKADNAALISEAVAEAMKAYQATEAPEPEPTPAPDFKEAAAKAVQEAIKAARVAPPPVGVTVTQPDPDARSYPKDGDNLGKRLISNQEFLDDFQKDFLEMAKNGTGMVLEEIA